MRVVWLLLQDDHISCTPRTGDDYMGSSKISDAPTLDTCPCYRTSKSNRRRRSVAPFSHIVIKVLIILQLKTLLFVRLEHYGQVFYGRKLLYERGAGSGKRGFLIIISQNFDNHGKGDLLLWIMNLWIL
jgi:hypothetical protein